MALTAQPQVLVAQHCTCCATPAALMPRDDLPGNLAVCPVTGAIYRPEGERYVPAALPPMAPDRPTPTVTIDLSRAGYA